MTSLLGSSIGCSALSMPARPLPVMHIAEHIRLNLNSIGEGTARRSSFAETVGDYAGRA